MCNFSSNIINDTLKSIFVEHLNTHIHEVLPVQWKRKGSERLEISCLHCHSLSTALTANTTAMGECEIQYGKNCINLLAMFPPNMFWLYWNWISIFVSSLAIYLSEASGAVQTWNRVWKSLLANFFCLFSVFYRINFRLTLQWIHIYDDYFDNIQFIHAEFAFNAHFTQGQEGRDKERRRKENRRRRPEWSGMSIHYSAHHICD